MKTKGRTSSRKNNEHKDPDLGKGTVSLETVVDEEEGTV